MPGQSRLLRIVSPYFVAGAIWERRGNGWVCVDAAPIIRWMVGRTPRVKDYLNRKGWTYEWVEASPAGPERTTQ